MNLVNANGYNRISIEPDGDILFTCRLFFNQAQVSLERYSDASDSHGVSINYNGYNGGTDYFRDFMVYNGKNSMVMMVDGSSGNVGIGTTAPDGTLHVVSGDASLPHGAGGDFDDAHVDRDNDSDGDHAKVNG